MRAEQRARALMGSPITPYVLLFINAVTDWGIPRETGIQALYGALHLNRGFWTVAAPSPFPLPPRGIGANIGLRHGSAGTSDRSPVIQRLSQNSQ